MAGRTPAAATSSEVFVDPIETKTISLAILGTQPIILNRMSEKARHELLMPKGRMTQADKATNLKHDPVSEFRASPYTCRSDDDPTWLAHMASAFKGAMMSAALDLPGAKRTQIGRLVWVEGSLVPLYGIPEIFSAITRSADIGRTPDVRTRCIVPEWAASLEVTFAVPLLNERSVINLLAAAGKICGIGDWRPEKGKGTFGQFTLVDHDDARFQRILKTGGREAQIAAMQDPRPFDQDTEELLAWFEETLTTRGKIRAVA